MTRPICPFGGEPADAMATIMHLRARVAELEFNQVIDKALIEGMQQRNLNLVAELKNATDEAHACGAERAAWKEKAEEAQASCADWAGRAIATKASLAKMTEELASWKMAAQEAEKEVAAVRAQRDAAHRAGYDITQVAEQIMDVLHCLDSEALAISMRISGAHGQPCRHPDAVQVLDDAETIIKAAVNLLLSQEQQP